MAERQANQNLDRPEHLDRAPRSLEDLFAIGSGIVADYLDPSVPMSAEDFANAMVELFDNPTAIEAYEREIARQRGGRDADTWH